MVQQGSFPRQFRGRQGIDQIHQSARLETRIGDRLGHRQGLFRVAGDQPERGFALEVIVRERAREPGLFDLLEERGWVEPAIDFQEPQLGGIVPLRPGFLQGWLEDLARQCPALIRR